MTTRKQIEAIPNSQELLDALVHEQASQLATATNNDGVKAQLEFLNTRGMTDEGVLQYLQEATDG